MIICSFFYNYFELFPDCFELFYTNCFWLFQCSDYFCEDVTMWLSLQIFIANKQPLPGQIGPKCGSVPTSPEPLEEPHQHLCPVWGLSIEIVTSLSSISASSTDLEEFKLHSFYSEVSEQIKSPSQLVGQAVEYKIEDKFESLLVIWQLLWKAIPEQGFENVGPWSLSKN